MSYVAYTEMGGIQPGDPVDESAYDPDDWKYMVEHGNVVLQGGEHDPNVLAARAAGVGYEDPRDAEIAALKAELAALKGEAPAEEESGTAEAPDDAKKPAASKKPEKSE